MAVVFSWCLNYCDSTRQKLTKDASKKAISSLHLRCTQLPSLLLALQNLAIARTDVVAQKIFEHRWLFFAGQRVRFSATVFHLILNNMLWQSFRSKLSPCNMKNSMDGESSRTTGGINYTFINFGVHHLNTHVNHMPWRKILPFFAFGNLCYKILKSLIYDVEIRIE